jgi:phospholipid/cholesterol/gamma-HCH transport system permease protein
MTMLITRVADTVGRWVIQKARALGDRVEFLGRTVIALGQFALGRSRRHNLRLVGTLQEAGVRTLPVVALFAVASGAVLTLVTTQQLDRLGVPHFTPTLVGTVILRELGALMAGIAMAGRVASAFAAEVATAMTTGEAEEMRSAGTDPVDVLVAPRVLALVLSGPLLVAYANGLALLGATAVGSGLLGAPARQYLDTILSALTFKHAVAGLVKGAVFGFVAGLAGCYHGFHSGTGSAAIGRTVRNAVVAAAVLVAIADVALAFIFRWIRL